MYVNTWSSGRQVIVLSGVSRRVLGARHGDEVKAHMAARHAALPFYTRHRDTR